ncbi:unnamed protein product [Adineta ricciae]|uniref:HTH La-type RNA-binding domain-containing protein n=1 Tax=Adineta ricciae TaxID=249248 RepID=A0A814U9M8_ADIRI|nr:unnamed protein product [Adineta ricciae]CAF1170630.1 unnamed protein product [Adineta ricciae]
MTDTDALYTKIVHEIESYLAETNLTNDQHLLACARKNDGWIRLELFRGCRTLSSYSYDKILRALETKRSSQLELSTFEPRCVRYRCETCPNGNSRTVIIHGLPRDVRYDDLIEFFNRFYPIDEVIFTNPAHASAFVHRSMVLSIIYDQDYQLSCELSGDNNDGRKDFMKGKSFSTRLSNQSSQSSVRKSDSTVRPKLNLKSTMCPTEQILFCQNSPISPSKRNDHAKQTIVHDKFSYAFYQPDRLLHQTHKSVIVSVLNPHCFTIQLSQDAIEFDRFQREINIFYNTMADKQYHITPQQIQINLCVICCDTKSIGGNQIWNRSQILDFDSPDNTVNVFHVDLGTWEEYVPITRLRHITHCFQQHQVFSLTCRLAGVLPLSNSNGQITWTDEATSQFLSVLDQVVPEVEFISITSNGCIDTNLFVTVSGQLVCVNDYLVHIKQATNGGQDNLQSERQENESSIHPVISLYKILGEVLQQSLIDSRTNSTSSSTVSSVSMSSRTCVKLIHVNINSSHTKIVDNPRQSHVLPMIFVRYKRTILIPDFNICKLFKIIDSSFDISAIENDIRSFPSTPACFNPMFTEFPFQTVTIGYNCVRITSETDSSIFSLLVSLNNMEHSDSITLYSLDFVNDLLQHYQFPIADVFLALENAKCAQLHESDLARWFAIDNKLKTALTPISNDFTKSDQSAVISPVEHQPLKQIRLPFSNRLITPT